MLLLTSQDFDTACPMTTMAPALMPVAVLAPTALKRGTRRVYGLEIKDTIIIIEPVSLDTQMPTNSFAQ